MNKKTKTTIAWVQSKRDMEYAKKVESLLSFSEEARIKYENKFNEFWIKSLEFRRIDYKAHGGLETWQANYRA